MDTGFQQFFNTDGRHNFPLVKTPKTSGHPAEHGIGFDVIMAGLPPHRGKFEAVSLPRHGVRAGKRIASIAQRRQVTIFI
jgi:hypothetical protein